MVRAAQGRPRGHRGCWAAGGGVEGATGESDPSSDAPGGWRRWVRNQCLRDRRPTQRLRAVRDAWAVARQSSELDGLLFQARPAVSPGQVGDAREARLRGDGLWGGGERVACRLRGRRGDPVARTGHARAKPPCVLVELQITPPRGPLRWIAGAVRSCRGGLLIASDGVPAPSKVRNVICT